MTSVICVNGGMNRESIVKTAVGIMMIILREKAIGMNELQSVTDIDEVIKYAEREAEGCHQTASAFHTDEGVYLHEETRFQYKAILWENIHEWLEELKERRKKQRPHGEWIYHKEWEWDGECAFECSKCGMGTDVDYNFCPNCGADMREEGEKNDCPKT